MVSKLDRLAALFVSEHRLEERLGPWPAVHFDPQLLPDSSGDFEGQVAAQAPVQAVAGLNERFHQAEFPNGEARSIKGRQSLADGGVRERPHAFQGGFMYDHGSRYEYHRGLVRAARDIP